MSREYRYEKNLHIASILSKTDWSEVNIHTLLQNPGSKQPSINAYLGARYSRSADSVWDIASEVMKKGLDPAERLEAIFHGYGHKSVGDMADLFLCIENVPMIAAMRIFNLNPVIAGQERSTRFQNFKDPKYVRIPKKLKVSKKLRDDYDKIIFKHLNDYGELLEPTKDALGKFFKIDRKDATQAKVLEARSFDVVRYFLPLGLQTSLGVVMSARSWADLIGSYRGSNQLVDQQLGELIYDILVGTKELNELGYVAEADGLIRHTESNTTRYDSACEAIGNLKKISKRLKMPKRPADHLELSYNSDAVATLISNIMLLDDPLADVNVKYGSTIRKKVGEIINKYHHHYRQIGCVGQSGAIQIDSFADQGILKDLNRHRSMERFIPFWNDRVDLENELDRDPSQMFFLCDYLYNKGLAKLRKDFSDRLTETYTSILDWYKNAKNEMSEDNVREFTRYLLPHAHATRYRFYGSIDDLQYTINLRTRNGGHIAYRNLTYQWLRELGKMDPYWKPLLNKIPEVRADSREQLLDRS